MKAKLLAVMVLGLGLAACGDKSASNSSTAPATPSESASTPAPTSVANELKSADGKVSVAVSGSFADKLGDAAALPENIKAEDLLFLQQNSDNETVIYAAKYGKVADSKAYFAQLEKAIKGDKSLKNVGFDAEKDGRIAYRFSQADATGETTLNESCVVEVAGEQTYAVCATSSNEDLAALDAIVKATVIAK